MAEIHYIKAKPGETQHDEELNLKSLDSGSVEVLKAASSKGELEFVFIPQEKQFAFRVPKDNFDEDKSGKREESSSEEYDYYNCNSYYLNILAKHNCVLMFDLEDEQKSQIEKFAPSFKAFSVEEAQQKFSELVSSLSAPNHRSEKNNVYDLTNQQKLIAANNQVMLDIANILQSLEAEPQAGKINLVLRQAQQKFQTKLSIVFKQDYGKKLAPKNIWRAIKHYAPYILIPAAAAVFGALVGLPGGVGDMLPSAAVWGGIGALFSAYIASIQETTSKAGRNSVDAQHKRDKVIKDNSTPASYFFKSENFAKRVDEEVSENKLISGEWGSMSEGWPVMLGYPY